MSAYYMRDGQLYTTKTMCNLVEFWQHEARVYPDEARRYFVKVSREMRYGPVTRKYDFGLPR